MKIIVLWNNENKYGQILFVYNYNVHLQLLLLGLKSYLKS